MIESNPFFMNGIVAVKEKKKKIYYDAKDLITSNSIIDRNHVHYDWSGHRSE